MTAQRQHRVNRIYVIESLPEGELRTGRELCEAVFAPRTPHNRDFSSARYEVKMKAEFLALLGQIECDTREAGAMPMLHIDAHGARDGLGLASGDFVPWAEMKAGITAINVACRNHLVVVLAACQGIHLISIIRAEERATAFAVISTATDVKAGDVAVSFPAFYEEMFRSRDGGPALRRLNDAVPGLAPRYEVVQSETMFLVAFQHYVNTYLTPEKVVQRTERLERASRKSLILDPRQQVTRREAIATELVDGLERRFNEARDRFFMVDLGLPPVFLTPS